MEDWLNWINEWINKYMKETKEGLMNEKLNVGMTKQ